MSLELKISNQPSTALATRLQEVMAEIGGAFGEDASPGEETIAAVAAAVEKAMADYGEDLTREGRVIELSSHALHALGETATARRLLVFGSGMVKAAIWEFSGGDPLWILDLRTMTVGEGAPLEMTLFLSLFAVLDTVADVWNAASGRGTLGLRHVLTTAELLAPQGRPKQRRDLSDEILRRVHDRLAHIARLRAWAAVPDVIPL
ncbi:MAG: hypothetical protein FWF84_05350 [Kiritimatiellaeota bacterium]|nr:hypothetical protein [Kiritimatiellota bacterium]